MHLCLLNKNPTILPIYPQAFLPGPIHGPNFVELQLLVNDLLSWLTFKALRTNGH
jgi:hypothetical protein